MNCGTPDHHIECLCDVIIVRPTEVNYRFTDVWHAEIVARATGYKGQGGEPLADFLEALARGYDATRNLAQADDDWLDGVRDPRNRDDIEALLRQGMSIIDMPEVRQDSFARIVATLTNGQPSLLWTWDERTWAEWEDAIEAETNPSVLGRQFGIDHKTAGRLLASYGKEATAAKPKPHLDRARVLFSQHPKATAAEVQALLEAEGIAASTAALRKIRQRMTF